MHLRMEPIDVSAQKNMPTAFCWRGNLYEVEQILEQWSAREQWWGKDDRREYFLIITTQGVMEIYSGRQGWMLSRVYD